MTFFAGDEFYDDDATSGPLDGPGGCPATREAVEERLDEGDIGCPICGGMPEIHEPEAA